MELSRKDLELIGLGFFLVLTELQGVREDIDTMRKDIRFIRQAERTQEMNAQDVLDKLTAQQELIQENTDAAASASALLDTIGQLIRDNLGDPEALQAIADQIDSENTSLTTNNSTLSAAVLRNTPAADVPFEVKIAADGDDYTAAEKRLWIYNAGRDVSTQASLPNKEEWDNLVL